jgi:hypothetical protein
MAKDKDPNKREEATESTESPAETEAAPPEIARSITVEAPRPSRIGSGLIKSSPSKIRYIN